MENALEWVNTALGHYKTLEKTQENESALKCLLNAIELLQKEEISPKGIVLSAEELSALYGAILSRQSQLKKHLEGIDECNVRDTYPELVEGWAGDFQALESIKAKAMKV